MEPIQETLSSIDYAVASDEWEDYIIAFREKLGQETYPHGPDIAVFWINKVDQLRVIRSNKNLIAGTPSFTDVVHERLVQIIYNLMPRNNQGKGPYKIRVTAVRNNEVVSGDITLAEFKFNRVGLAERTGGVIHNPPYSKY